MPSFARATPDSSHASRESPVPFGSTANLFANPKTNYLLPKRCGWHDGNAHDAAATATTSTAAATISPDYYPKRISSSSSMVSSSTSSMMMAAPPPTTDSSKKRDSKSGLPPPLTQEEFAALPIAVQRKYFSTLERLRFAQPSAVEGIFDHYVQNSKRSRRFLADRSNASDYIAGRIRRKPLRQPSTPSSPPPPPPQNQPSLQPLDVESLAFVTSLPDKIKKRQFTREEQVALARHLRTSVILDAADEAVYKVGRRANGSRAFAAAPTINSDLDTLDLDTLDPRTLDADTLDSDSLRFPPVPSPLSMDTVRDPRSTPREVPQSFYDSFRWMDEEDDLDLRLFMDDYHANLREDSSLPQNDRRPSFRRRLSISKLPFSRSSLSSRPATKDDSSNPTSPLHSPQEFVVTPPVSSRRRSRTVSLITSSKPRTQQDCAAAAATLPIDHAAAHYQDPEARLKLRVYLASPQKFDEAIEFGFPSVDACGLGPPKYELPRIPKMRHTKLPIMEPLGPLGTFFADDDDDDDDDDDADDGDQNDQKGQKEEGDDRERRNGSLSSSRERFSDGDPDSPLASEKAHGRPQRLVSDGYAQLPAASREMTLRMTLTRPDLRAAEDQTYRWRHPQPLAPYRPPKLPSGSIEYDMGSLEPTHKGSLDRSLVGHDHWGAPQDGNVMKRIWNRVRRS